MRNIRLTMSGWTGTVLGLLKRICYGRRAEMNFGWLSTISRRSFVWMLAVTIAGGAQLSQPTRAIAAPLQRILFVGNSLTYYNGGLDQLLMQMAEQSGKMIECGASTSGGKSLEWHWDNGNARQLIARGGWDWVVLQDLSVQPLNKRHLLVAYGRRFDSVIKQAGAKTAFYITMARQNQPKSQNTITDAYETLAAELGATVVPCGLAWQRATEQIPGLRLHRSDLIHPTIEGTYLNACCFYATLLREDPGGLPAPTIREEGGGRRTLSDQTAKTLQRIAWETVSQVHQPAGAR
jgi:hypothetical protein